MRILLVEDDSLLGKGVVAGLAQAGWAVDWVVDGLDAEAALKTNSYDSIVLDLGLPGIDGLTLLGRLRAAKDRTPVLVLTARDTLADRVAGLDAGGDDYLVKPFELAELQARLRALLRRSKGAAGPLLQHGRVALDPASHAVFLDGDTGRAFCARIRHVAGIDDERRKGAHPQPVGRQSLWLGRRDRQQHG
ncbi:MAG: response regulator [Cypionkella sp.]